MKKYILILALIFFCLPSNTLLAASPESTAKQMIAMACAGNREAFFAHVDKAAVGEGLKKRNSQKGRKLEDRNRDKYKDKKPASQTDAEMLESMKKIEDELKRKIDKMTEILVVMTLTGVHDGIEKGNFCEFKIVGADKNKVIIEDPIGKQTIWTYKKEKGKWMLINIFPISALKEPDSRSTDSSIKTSKPASSKLINDKSYDFRKARWGMTMEQVKKNEQAQFIGGIDETLLYDDDIAGLPVSLIYVFTNKKLTRAGYRIDKTYSDYNQYLKDYEVLKNAFTKKYGEPYASGADWKNDTYKNNPEKYGQALSQGHFSYISIWVTQTTDITLGLYKKDGEIKFGVYYMPISKDGPNIDYKIGEQEIEEKL